MAFQYQFPDPMTAEADGLLAVGGDLSIESLLTAYSKGIFPWYDENTPILWWSPDPRLVLFPDNFKVSDSLNQKIRKNTFEIKIDNDFEKVIAFCAQIKRKYQDGTWITAEMQKAYINLYHHGYAHSVETYFEGNLVGGLYGVSLGKAFFGESMFHNQTDASKVALFYLVAIARHMNFHFIDAQQSTQHLISLGATEIPRRNFIKMLEKALKYPTIKGNWKNIYNDMI